MTPDSKFNSPDWDGDTLEDDDYASDDDGSMNSDNSAALLPHSHTREASVEASMADPPRQQMDWFDPNRVYATQRSHKPLDNQDLLT